MKYQIISKKSNMLLNDQLLLLSFSPSPNKIQVANKSVKMECYPSSFSLTFVICSEYPLWSNYVFYLLPCTTMPPSQPEKEGRGMAIREGIARREIKKICYANGVSAYYQKLLDALYNGAKGDLQSTKVIHFLSCNQLSLFISKMFLPYQLKANG